MIAQLTGTLVSVRGMDVVLDVHGVGYVVSVPLSTLDVVSRRAENVTLLTVLQVREDSMTLFGFATDAERESFYLLTNVQGIGGRTAIGILSATSIADLRKNLVAGNAAALQRLPGVGKKTAERMIIELREKMIGVVPERQGAEGADAVLAAGNDAIDDAVSALLALGFTRAAAEKAVSTVVDADTSLRGGPVDAIIRKALRN
ncbi:MAG TPA: Holliday junction branch migration protein RuvA [Bacteroidetes bacterium]|nr:Holliday junction branch migration protein RuvA [Bacteroidota bacterium]HRK04041.1 Holliday junction branch migration protein RuvA [Chlorobiota bacterium]